MCTAHLVCVCFFSLRSCLGAGVGGHSETDSSRGGKVVGRAMRR